VTAPESLRAPSGCSNLRQEAFPSPRIQGSSTRRPAVCYIRANARRGVQADALGVRSGRPANTSAQALRGRRQVSSALSGRAGGARRKGNRMQCARPRPSPKLRRRRTAAASRPGARAFGLLASVELGGWAKKPALTSGEDCKLCRGGRPFCRQSAVDQRLRCWRLIRRAPRRSSDRTPGHPGTGRSAAGKS